MASGSACVRAIFSLGAFMGLWSAAADRADDLDAVAHGERRVGMAAPGHDLSVALDGDPLAFECEFADQVGDGCAVPADARGAVDDDGKHGNWTTIRRPDSSTPEGEGRPRPRRPPRTLLAACCHSVSAAAATRGRSTPTRCASGATGEA